MNNDAARSLSHNCKFICFLNNDVEAIAPGWATRLRSLLCQPGVGAVGPALLYGNLKVQHAGVIIGLNGPAEHAKKGATFFDEGGKRISGPDAIFSVVRECSAVTAACMMVNKADFDVIGGFDEDLAVGFNDTDLCLRLGEIGKKILYDGSIYLMHYESATRRRNMGVEHPDDTARFETRWEGLLRDGDPFYSPLLSLDGKDYALGSKFNARKFRPRVTILRDIG
jgi:GT2 family glycosyltransferase